MLYSIIEGGHSIMEIYDRGLRLKALRKKCRLSQQEVADRLGITRSTVSAYECNNKSPSLDVLERMAVLYHSSVDYMLGMDNRTSFYIDDLTPAQQEIILNIVQMLRDEWTNL
jgi:transcriptional regulator with XRE-family HTH domain